MKLGKGLIRRPEDQIKYRGKIQKQYKNKRSIKKYFSYHQLSDDIKNYGYEFQRKNYILSFLLIEIAFLLTAVLFRLNKVGVLIVIGMGLVSLPQMIRIHFSYLNKQKIFHDVDLYIHQMAYSFQRYPKINLALHDTEKVVSSKMRKTIEQALHELQYGVSQTIYKDALAWIQHQYNCSRVTALHEFLISIEERGGMHQNAIEVLLWDFDSWTKRVYKHQKDMKRVKFTSEIGILLCLVISLTTTVITMILNASSHLKLSIDHEPIYQIVSTAFLVVCVLYYQYIQSRFNRDWIKRERTDAVILKDLNLAQNSNIRDIRIRSIPIYVGCIMCSFVLFICHVPMMGTFFLFVILILFFIPVYNVKQAKKRVQDDVYAAFTEWLRDVAINLQDETLTAAIEETYDQCHVVLKSSLKRFIYQIENDPADVTAYYNFLSEFQIEDVSATIKTLYSLTIQDADDIDATINSIIKRNYEMMEKHDQIMYEDNISVLQFCEYIPTIFVSIKIAVDMMLVIMNYL